jgi:hypothetical protein
MLKLTVCFKAEKVITLKIKWGINRLKPRQVLKTISESPFIIGLFVACQLFFSLNCFAGQREREPLGAPLFLFGGDSGNRIMIIGSWSDEKNDYRPNVPNVSEVFCEKDVLGCTVLYAGVSAREWCVFRAKSGSDSDGSRAPIPIDGGH